MSQSLRQMESELQNGTLWPTVHQMPPSPPRCRSHCWRVVEVLTNASAGTFGTRARLPGVCNSPGRGRL